jgi:hypothetical protein
LIRAKNVCRQTANDPLNICLQDCFQMLALHSRVLQKARLLAFGRGDLDEELRGFCFRPLSRPRNQSNNRVLQTAVIMIGLHNERWANLSAGPGTEFHMDQNNVAAAHGHSNFRFSS